MQLAEFHYQILDYIEQHPYSSGPELKTVFPNNQMRIERALVLLSSRKFLLFTTATNDKIYEQHKDEEIPRMEALGFEFNWRFFLSGVADPRGQGSGSGISGSSQSQPGQDTHTSTRSHHTVAVQPVGSRANGHLHGKGTEIINKQPKVPPFPSHHIGKYKKGT